MHYFHPWHISVLPSPLLERLLSHQPSQPVHLITLSHFECTLEPPTLDIVLSSPILLSSVPSSPHPSGSAFSNHTSFRVPLSPHLLCRVFSNLTSFQVRFSALVPLKSNLFSNISLSSRLLNDALSSPIMSSLQKNLFYFISLGHVTHHNQTFLKTLFIFHLGRLPITMKPFWDILAFLTPSKIFHLGQWPIAMKPFWEIFVFLTTLTIFHPGQLPITIKQFWEIFAFLTTLKNLRIFYIFEKFCVFHLGRSPITTRSLWKIFVFFTSLKKLCFSPGQVAHYYKTTLKNLHNLQNLSFR